MSPHTKIDNSSRLGAQVDLLNYGSPSIVDSLLSMEDSASSSTYPMMQETDKPTPTGLTNNVAGSSAFQVGNSRSGNVTSVNMTSIAIDSQGSSDLLSLSLDVFLKICDEVFPVGAADNEISLLLSCKLAYLNGQEIYLRNTLFVIRYPLKLEYSVSSNEDLSYFSHDETWFMRALDPTNGFMLNEAWASGVKLALNVLFDDPTLRAELRTDLASIWESDNDSNKDPSIMAKRGHDMADQWIRKSPFAAFLRGLGPEKAAMIGHMRIECATVKAMEHGVPFMAAVSSAAMPQLKSITLRLTPPSYYQQTWLDSNALTLVHANRPWISLRVKEDQKAKIMAELPVARAIKCLVKDTTSLEELRFDDWGNIFEFNDPTGAKQVAIVPAHWWARWEENMKLRVVVERRNPEAKEEKIIIFQ